MVRRHLAALAGLMVSVLLGGCTSPLPIAEGYPVERQKVMQSTAHWRILAADLGDRIQKRQALQPELRDKPIYVQRQQAQTPFNGAFHEFLVAELMDRGIRQTLVPPVRPQDAMVLKYTTQIVRYDSDRVNRPAPGVLTEVAALVAIPLAVAPQSPTALQAGSFAMGDAVLADALAGEWVNDGTATELLVTTSVYDGASMWFHETDGFYIGDRDFGHYEPVRPATKIIAY